MRVNSNMLMGLVLCMVLFGGVAFLTRMNNTQHDWAPNDIYSSVGGSSYSTANVTASSAPTSGVTFPLQRGRSVSRSMRSSRAVSSYAPAQHTSIAHTQYPIGGTPSNNVASPLYTTSSATMKSFGGGGTMGVSVSGGSVRSSASQPTMSATSMSLSAMSAPALAYDPSASQSLFSEIAMAIPAYQGIGNTTIGGPRGLGGRFNAPPGMGGSGSGETGWGVTWLNWLDEWYSGEDNNKWGTFIDGVWGLTWYELKEAYEQWKAAYLLKNPGAQCPDFDEWLLWFGEGTTHTGASGNGYTFVPVGDCLVLLVLALFYVVYIALRRYKSLQLTKNEKS